MPRKGVTPPQLRPFLFRKGGGRGATRRRSRASGGGARSFGRSMRSHAAHFGSEVKHRWLEMLLAGTVGYVLPSTLTNLGVGWALYDGIPQYRSAMDTLYGAAEKVGAPGNNPYSNGGLVGIGKVAGIADVSRRVLKASKAGKFSGGDLVGAAFDLGLVFDGPGDGMTSHSSSGGYW